MPEPRRAATSEVEAAYFTLLRAREEVEALRRYSDYLTGERRRLQRFVRDGDALEARVDRRLRRPLRETDRRLAAALRGRHRVIDEELAELPDRIEAAEQFVEECRSEYEGLRDGTQG